MDGAESCNKLSPWLNEVWTKEVLKARNALGSPRTTKDDHKFNKTPLLKGLLVYVTGWATLEAVMSMMANVGIVGCCEPCSCECVTPCGP